MRFLPRHLNHRTTLLVAIILCVTGIISGWLGAHRQSDRLVAAMGDHSAVMVRHFAENCARFLVLEDYAELETFLRKSAELPNVTHLQVCEPDGRIVGDITRNQTGELVSTEGSRKIPLPQSITESHSISGEMLTFWQPITSGRLLGWIRADFSLASIRQTQQVTWRQNIGLTLFWDIVSVGLILIILRPTAVVLEKLALFARSLHECKGEQIEVHSDTIEIEALEEALNYASTRLLTTERQLVSDRERLAKSEENYRQLLDTIQEGIWVIDQHAVTTFVNPRMAEILGYAPGEMLGRPLFNFMDDQGKAVAEQNIERRKSGIKEQHDFEFIRKDGNRIYTRLETGPIFDKDGKYIGSIAAVADVTARKEAEARLQESEERLRLTLEATRIGIWDWDVQNDQWYASPMYYAMLGYPPENGPADRNGWLERVHPDDRAMVLEKIQDVLTRDFKNYQYEARIRHADGSYRWQQVQGFGIRRDTDGKVSRMLGIRMDIDERKIAEKQLETLNADLDQLVRDRTMELQEKNADLERMNKIFVGRELRMVELKERIRELETQLCTDSERSGP